MYYVFNDCTKTSTTRVTGRIKLQRGFDNLFTILIVNSVAPPVSGEEYDDIMPAYSNFPDCFVSVIPFLLASLA